MEKPINQRIKFLLESLKLSARDFSRAVGVADNNTQNYLEPRFAQPKADYLEKVMLHFGSINPAWLLTGKGEPFIKTDNETDSTSPQNQKFFRSPVIGTNNGTGYSEQNTNSSELDAVKTQLALSEKEVEHLREQLKKQEEHTLALLASRDIAIAAQHETITLLRASYNRPN